MWAVADVLAAMRAAEPTDEDGEASLAVGTSPLSAGETDE
jgi:hypothetical protein